MDEDDGNNFVRFKTTNHNTTTNKRYPALNTDEIQLIRFIADEMPHGSHSKLVLLLLLQNTITTVCTSISQIHHLQIQQRTAQNWLLLLCLSLLISPFNEYEIRQIKTAYFNGFSLFIDDFQPGVVDDERNRTTYNMSDDHCKSYTRF